MISAFSAVSFQQMTDERAFIETIHEHPDDDGPRLVYADWLEENGDCARAEFIRVQIELARTMEEDERFEQLKAREAKLLNSHEREWLGQEGAGNAKYEFKRGMLEGVATTSEVLLNGARKTVDFAPIIRMRIRVRPEHLSDLASCQALKSVRHLDLTGNRLQPLQLQRLLHSRYVKQLTSLDLSINQLTSLGSGCVMDGKSLPNLHELNLSRCRLQGGSWVRGMRRLPGLLVVNLSWNSLGNSGARELARSSFVQTIRCLNLSHCSIEASGIASIARSKRFRKLTDLDLSYNRIHDAGAQMLATATALSGLESLSLEGSDIGWVGGNAIAQSQALDGIRRLNLSRNRITPRIVKRLEARFGSRVKF